MEGEISNDTARSSGDAMPPAFEPLEEPEEPSVPKERSKETEPRAPSEPWPEVLGGDGPADPDDWRQFDIHRVLRSLRLAKPKQCELTLRKLHIRWWHASSSAMTKLLGRAGVPKLILDLIPAIVQTCGVCRNWAKPQPATLTNVEMPDRFNEQLEADIMFALGLSIFHMIDRCTRWYQSFVIPNREDGSLIKALDSWFRLHGPCKELFFDQETGIQNSKDTTEYLTRKGIKYIPRAKGQNVPHIDRRGALVREVMNKMVDQLKIEGIKMTAEQILAEATFVTNAMLTINNCTPYNAVYGRVPNILPDIDRPDAINEGALNHPGSIRNVHRLREIAVQAMVEETAKVRAGRALNARSQPTVAPGTYKIGDQVDFYRKGGSKDVTGWTGPATVLDPYHMDRGTITIRHLHRPVDVQVGDIRFHLPFLVYLAAETSALDP